MTKAEQCKFLAENDQFVPTVRELTIASIYLLKQAQKSLPKDVKRTYAMLLPIMDEYGVWRVMGCTAQAKDNPPALIPKDEPLAQVLLRHFHSPNHAGSDATLTLLRQQFWIINGPKVADQFVKDCSFCRFLRKEQVQVEISPKKMQQITRSPVFSIITVDIAGPYETKGDRRITRNYNVSTEKVWVLLIVCRVPQASHLELMEAYDTNAFLSAPSLN
jgi:hypothetical protein